jgi:ATP-dependent Zn protease
MTKFFTNLLVVFLIMLGIIYLFSTIDKLNVTKQDVSLNELISKIQENKIKKIIVKPDTITGILEDENQLVAKKENTISVFETLKYYDVPSTTIQNLNISFAQDLD